MMSGTFETPLRNFGLGANGAAHAVVVLAGFRQQTAIHPESHIGLVRMLIWLFESF
jgi:hypothetical protein